VGIWWSTILGLVLSAWAVRSPLHPADSNFGRILTTDLPLSTGVLLEQQTDWKRK
jgi:hypothetical protein